MQRGVHNFLSGGQVSAVLLLSTHYCKRTLNGRSIALTACFYLQHNKKKKKKNASFLLKSQQLAFNIYVGHNAYYTCKYNTLLLPLKLRKIFLALVFTCHNFWPLARNYPWRLLDVQCCHLLKTFTA